MVDSPDRCRCGRLADEDADGCLWHASVRAQAHGWKQKHHCWIAPFPRLRFRLRYGYWCIHNYPTWDIINNGENKMRRCRICDHVEFCVRNHGR